MYIVKDFYCYTELYMDVLLVGAEKKIKEVF